MRNPKPLFAGLAIVLTLVASPVETSGQELKDSSAIHDHIEFKTVEQKRDPKTGVVVGGENTTELIKGLTEINGTAVGEQQADDVPAKNQEGDLVLIKAFDAGPVRTTLAHKVFSPDKKLFAGYYRDGFDEVISIHETKTRKQIKRFLAQGDEIRELKFTPDGKLLASRCVNPDRKGWALWDVSTGRLVLRLPVPPSDD
jgi:hypothetical protein